MKLFDPKTMEASCPECGSEDFDVHEYDFGTCRETGYRDAGERATCCKCGFEGELRGDFERTKVTVKPAQKRCKTCNWAEWQKDGSGHVMTYRQGTCRFEFVLPPKPHALTILVEKHPIKYSDAWDCPVWSQHSDTAGATKAASDPNWLSAELTVLDSLLRAMPENDYLGRMGLEARRDALRHESQK